MIDSSKWKLYPTPVFTWPGGALEDFMVIERAANKWEAIFTAGASLGDQRLHLAYGEHPLGPFDAVEVDNDGSEPSNAPPVHTRLERGRIDEALQVVMTVWPGLPQCGLYLFEARSWYGGPYFTTRVPLVSPKPGTGYSIVAGNPCVFDNPQDGTLDIWFEGRSEEKLADGSWRWRLYHACWNWRTPEAIVDPEPICDGANPSFLSTTDPETGKPLLVLYHSRWNQQIHGFDTWAFTQEG